MRRGKETSSGSFGFWLRFRSVTGRRGHVPSLKPRQTPKFLAAARLQFFFKRSRVCPNNLIEKSVSLPHNYAMKLCGLTGGVGMGKSTTANLLRKRQIPLVDTDELARELVQPGQPALAEIQTAFGQSVISNDGQLRRDELAKIVFADTMARKKLEGILHPKIREGWLARVENWKKEKSALAFVIIPLLFETKAQPHFEKIICVACSGNSQRERLAARGWTSEQIRQRVAAQMPVEDKISRSDFVIWTEGDIANHSLQLDRILARL
jgi:dephospho-CoA kinase